MRAIVVTTLVSFASLLTGCIEPDLGDVPFFCNTGDPKCPDGYECVAGQCVLEGLSPSAEDSGGQADQGLTASDTYPKQGDTLQQSTDSSSPPTGPKWDVGTSPPPPPADSGSTSSCLGNSDCTDPLYPCCCLGVCEMVCLFTLCF